MDQITEIGPVERHEQVTVTELPGGERREQALQVVQDVGAEARQLLLRITNVVWLVTVGIEGVIALRIMLKLLAANPNNPFASFVYSFSRLFVGPFLGLTVTPSSDGIVFEIPSVIAMLVYALLAWFIVKLIWVLFEKPRAGSVSFYERDQSTRPGGTASAR